MNFVFASGGNDSIALIQWMIENDYSGVVVYNNTKWAADWWPARIEKLKAFLPSNQFTFEETQSMGFAELAKWRQAFPRQGIQFCTKHLKVIPSMKLMDELDPETEGTVFIGVRREESANRRNFPEHVEESEAHGGRDCWAPLVRHTEAMRDDLLARAGFEPLPHRSQECYPCINSNRKDLQQVDENRIRVIELLEAEMGVGKRSGNPKTMFRPYRHQGAVGIRAIKHWADRTIENDPQFDMFGAGCDSGFCS